MTAFHPLLMGAFELHCHTSPSIFPRRQTDWELVDDVRAAGMAGVVIKSHEAQTADRAALLRERHPELHVYGGLACNYFTGGLSPTAVDAALRAGAKVIWMPTFSARAHQEHFARKKTPFFASQKPLTHPGQGLEILDEQGKVRPEVNEILSLIAEADVLLATGHLSPAEVMVLVDAAIAHGVKKILAQHTDLGIARIPFEMELQLVRKGVVLEKCYLACSNDFNDITPVQMADSIRRLGPGNCVMVTDYGQQHNIPVINALSAFVGAMVGAGIAEKDIKRMIEVNPRQLLGL